jgi:hypothetical protein
MMARYLVHVVGDIHQPLHSSSFFDNGRFKNGDEGGNFFLIKFKNNIENLHKLFDSGIDRLRGDLHRPLNAEAIEYLKKTATEFMNEFPKSSLPEMNNILYEDWVQESHDISQDFIYKSIEYNSTPSEEFLEKSYYIVKRRIALGGYRLAEIFKHVKSSFDKVEEFLK